MQLHRAAIAHGRVADKLAVVRSMHHARGGADAHPNGTQYALSGAHPAAAALTMPDIGSVVSHLLGSECKYLPPYIMVPGNHEQAAETRTGFLPAGTKVFKTGGKNLADPAWKIDGLVPRGENQGDRLVIRHGLRDALAGQQRSTGTITESTDRAWTTSTIRPSTCSPARRWPTPSTSSANRRRCATPTGRATAARATWSAAS